MDRATFWRHFAGLSATQSGVVPGISTTRDVHVQEDAVVFVIDSHLKVRATLIGHHPGTAECHLPKTCGVPQ